MSMGYDIDDPRDAQARENFAAGIYKHQGPVKIVDAAGTHPSALDRAVEEQAAYYRRSTK